MGIGTSTPNATLDVRGTLFVETDLTMLPAGTCRNVTLNTTSVDLGTQLAGLLAKYRCIYVTLAANTSWTWNVPTSVGEFQTLRIWGEGAANGATNITVNVLMTQNQTVTVSSTAYRDPVRLSVADYGRFSLAGVNLTENSNDARPLSPGSCSGGALFTSGSSYSLIDLEQLRIVSSEDVVGVGTRSNVTVQFGHTFIDKGPSSPRNILASKLYTGWCFAGGHGLVHNSHTTLGANVSYDTNPKLVYSN